MRIEGMKRQIFRIKSNDKYIERGEGGGKKMENGKSRVMGFWLSKKKKKKGLHGHAFLISLPFDASLEK